MNWKNIFKEKVMLTQERIEELSNQKGVRKNAVLNFLCSVDANENKSEALANLKMDKDLYKWNLQTVRAIRKGIDEYFGK